MSMTLTKDFYIRPDDIKINKDSEAIASEPIDLTTTCIIQMCQQEGKWQPFSRHDLQIIFPSFDYSDTWLDELVSQNLIIIGDDNLYHITREFIQKCFKKSPATKIQV